MIALRYDAARGRGMQGAYDGDALDPPDDGDAPSCKRVNLGEFSGSSSESAACGGPQL
jgi:hypothetical protein